MFASIITAKVKSNQINQATDTLRQILTGINPDGWQHTYLVVDQQTGQLLSFGIWDSEAHAAAYESSGRFQADAQKMMPFLESAPTRTTGEIVAKIQK